MPRQNKSSDLRRSIGQLLIIGFDGTEMSPGLAALLTRLQPAGVILFARNITGVATAAKSTTEGADYTNKAAGELARLASTMQTLVRQFDFGTDDQPKRAADADNKRNTGQGTKKKASVQRPMVNGAAQHQEATSIQ